MALYEVTFSTVTRKVITASTLEEAALLAAAAANADTVKVLSVKSVPALMQEAIQESKHAR